MSRTKKRTVRVTSVETNFRGDPVFWCQLLTPAGAALVYLPTSNGEIDRAGGLRQLVAGVLKADKVVIERGVR